MRHWAGTIKHRLASLRGPAQEVDLFQAQAFLPPPIAERLPPSIFLDELTTQDQVSPAVRAGRPKRCCRPGQAGPGAGSLVRDSILDAPVEQDRLGPSHGA